MEASRRSRKKKEAEIEQLKKKIDSEKRRNDELRSLVETNKENKFNADNEYYFRKKFFGVRMPDSHLE